MQTFCSENKPSPRSPEWRGFAGFANRELVLAAIKELLPGNISSAQLCNGYQGELEPAIRAIMGLDGSLVSVGGLRWGPSPARDPP